MTRGLRPLEPRVSESVGEACGGRGVVSGERFTANEAAGRVSGLFSPPEDSLRSSSEPFVRSLQLLTKTGFSRSGGRTGEASERTQRRKKWKTTRLNRAT